MVTVTMAASRRPTYWRIGADQLSYLALTMIAIGLRWSYFGHPAPDYDEQIYQLIGQRMLDGALPYVDIWDRKPLGLFLIYAFSNLVGGPGPLPYQLFACTAAIGGAILVYHLAKRFADPVGAFFAGALYLIYLSAFDVRVGQSEIFFIPVLTAMTMLTIGIFQTNNAARAHRLSLFVMVSGGVALQLKYTVLPQCLLFGVLALARQIQLSVPPRILAVRFVLYGALGLLPTVGAAAFYLANGHLDAFVYANFLSIFSRGALADPQKSFFMLKVVLVATPLVITALAGMSSFLRQPSGSRRAYLIILFWTASALLSCLMVGNIYPHYFAQAVPGLLVLAAPAACRSGAGVVLTGICASVGIMCAAPAAKAEIARDDWRGYDQTVAAAASYLRSPKAGCAYVFDGPTSIYRDTHSCIPTVYAYPDHLSNSMEASAIGVDARAEVARILAARPGVIITASHPIVPRYNPATAALVDQAVARDYVRVGTYFYHPRKLYVNVRRDLLPGRGSLRLP